MGLLEWIFGPNIKKLKKNGDLDGLVALLSHKDPHYRSRAIWALETFGAHCPLQPIHQALQDESQAVRLNAALALLALDPPNGKKRLEETIDGPGEPFEIKVALAIALDYSKSGSYTGRECLATARAAPQEKPIDDGMRWLRTAGHMAGYSKFVEALGRGGDPELRQVASGILRNALSADCVRDAHVGRIQQALDAH